MNGLRFYPDENDNQAQADARSEYGTPWDVFTPLHQEFGFDVDVCAKEWNKKLDKYYSPQQDGLLKNWEGKAAWCNPPYGAESIEDWLIKAVQESERGITTAMLLPSTTDVKWYHRYVWDRQHNRTRHGVQLRFFEGRIKFLIPPALRKQGQKSAGGHTGSMLVVIHPVGTIHNGICLACGK